MSRFRLDPESRTLRRLVAVAMMVAVVVDREHEGQSLSDLRPSRNLPHRLVDIEDESVLIGPAKSQ